jgi:Arc/MetJ-type ribon-helix-helix transcriptional regulator
MINDNHEPSSTLFLTVDTILAAHQHLLAAQSDREDVLEMRSFIDRLTESGAYFDEAFERKAIQGTLDYWTSELARHQTDEEPAGRRRRAIGEFNAEALKALQPNFENPFARISDRVDSLGAEDRHFAAAILKLVSETAQASNLRFQEGLLKELVCQVTGGREDATLLEFCLWHLFEDPETRSGNKMYRPKKSQDKDERVEFFSCKAV